MTIAKSKAAYESPAAEAVLISSVDVITSSGSGSGSGGSSSGGTYGEWDPQ